MTTSLLRNITLFAFVAILILFMLAAVTIRSALAVQTTTNYVTEVTTRQVELSGQINTDLFRGITEALTYARTRDPANQATALQEMEDAAALTDELGAIKAESDILDDRGAAFAQLQEKRLGALQVIRPAIAELLGAVDADNSEAIAAALDALNEQKPQIEALEEATGEIVQRAIGSVDRAGDQSSQVELLSVGLSFGLLVLMSVLAAALVQRQIIQPVTSLASAIQLFASGESAARVSVTSRNEIGALQTAFNRMAADLAASQAQVAEHQRVLEARVAERTATLSQTLDELTQSTAERAQLQETMLAMSSPIIPVADDIIVMPLVGVIDTDRAAALLQMLPYAIEARRARTVILDVTGVPIIDTQVARVLLRAAQTSRLLGAQTILVGLRPELAQTIVGLGLDLSALITQSNLQAGIAYAFRQRPAPGRTL